MTRPPVPAFDPERVPVLPSLLADAAAPTAETVTVENIDTTNTYEHVFNGEFFEWYRRNPQHGEATGDAASEVAYYGGMELTAALDRIAADAKRITALEAQRAKDAETIKRLADLCLDENDQLWEVTATEYRDRLSEFEALATDLKWALSVPDGDSVWDYAQKIAALAPEATP